MWPIYFVYHLRLFILLWLFIHLVYILELLSFSGFAVENASLGFNVISKFECRCANTDKLFNSTSKQYLRLLLKGSVPWNSTMNQSYYVHNKVFIITILYKYCKSVKLKALSIRSLFKVTQMQTFVFIICIWY